MAEVSVVGYPRIGADRELKKVTEQYFKGSVTAEELTKAAAELRRAHWRVQVDKKVRYIPSNDFSFYDNLLDMALTLDAIPRRYRELGLSPRDVYFAMARGYQKGGHDVKALPMKKWFNTNYHYMVPEIEDGTRMRLADTKILDEYAEAKALGIETKPVVPGPLTFLKLSWLPAGKGLGDYRDEIVEAYGELISRLAGMGVEMLQIDEPVLVTDLSSSEIELFTATYSRLLAKKGRMKILLQTYFGDVHDTYDAIMKLNFDAIGLDFVEGRENLRLIKESGFPAGRLLIAGVVNGRNVWRNDYAKTLALLDEIRGRVNEAPVIGTSCSLLFTPYSVRYEKEMEEEYKRHLAFAEEKLDELREIAELYELSDRSRDERFKRNQALVREKAESKSFHFKEVRERVSALTERDFVRKPPFEERFRLQKSELKLPVFPTTTIGSFPQTGDVRKLRKALHDGEISQQEYVKRIRAKIRDLIKLQEEIGLDVLVHGEYERSDMVEYFGENLPGFLFTQNGWVQSYGTRCVRPPIIFGDVKREKPFTVEWITFAQSLTKRPVKGMLTGPITILNWSFPREDLPLREIAYQIALAIRDEVLDLEKAGIRVIQIDEPALREKLPLRKANWKKDYLDWAVLAFRLVHSGVRPETQIHTHMCYSEFADIIKEIEEMDADVISIEAARSDLTMLGVLRENNYSHQVGPGVYDIHSPRVPPEQEIRDALMKMKDKLDMGKIWVNPDCGLKTRSMEETVPSLKNLVEAARSMR